MKGGCTMKQEEPRYFSNEGEKLRKKNRSLKRWLSISVLLSGGLLVLEPIDDKIIEEKVRKQYEQQRDAAHYGGQPSKEELYGEKWYLKEENKRYPYTFKEIKEKGNHTQGEYFEDLLLVHKIHKRETRVELVGTEGNFHYKVIARVSDPDFYELKEGMVVKAKGDITNTESRGNWNYIAFYSEDFSLYPVKNVKLEPWKGKDE